MVCIEETRAAMMQMQVIQGFTKKQHPNQIAQCKPHMHSHGHTHAHTRSLLSGHAVSGEGLGDGGRGASSWLHMWSLLRGGTALGGSEGSPRKSSTSLPLLLRNSPLVFLDFQLQ